MGLFKIGDRPDAPRSRELNHHMLTELYKNRAERKPYGGWHFSSSDAEEAILSRVFHHDRKWEPENNPFYYAFAGPTSPQLKPGSIVMIMTESRLGRESLKWTTGVVQKMWSKQEKPNGSTYWIIQPIALTPYLNFRDPDLTDEEIINWRPWIKGNPIRRMQKTLRATKGLFQLNGVE
jgi:hypothetical protein